jgi:hypothetical protein
VSGGNKRRRLDQAAPIDSTESADALSPGPVLGGILGPDRCGWAGFVESLAARQSRPSIGK